MAPIIIIISKGIYAYNYYSNFNYSYYYYIFYFNLEMVNVHPISAQV